MSRTRYRNNMPPGLKAQIVFAVVITVGALLLLPTALSAQQSVNAVPATKAVALPSAGSVATTIQEFHTADFTAAEFSDWD